MIIVFRLACAIDSMFRPYDVVLSRFLLPLHRMSLYNILLMNFSGKVDRIRFSFSWNKDEI